MNTYQKKADEYLKDYMRLYNLIKKKYLEIDFFHGKVTGGAIRYDKDKIMTTPTNMLEEAACEVDEVQRELEQLLPNYNELRSQLKRYVRRIKDEDARMVIKMHYLYDAPWKDIPDRLYMSERTMWRKRDVALIELGKMLARDEDNAIFNLIKLTESR